MNVNHLPKHKWEADHVRRVYLTCRANSDMKTCFRLLKQDFPDCSDGSILFAIRRYIARNDNKLEWSPFKNGCKDGWAKQGKVWDAVWNESNYRRLLM